MKNGIPGLDAPEPLPTLYARSQPIPKRKMPPLPPEKRVGVAIVGLGTFALEHMLPAFRECNFARLAAIMTGDPAGKGAHVAQQHGIKEEAVYGYNEWEKLKSNKDVQFVYIITPNFMHKEQVMQAAKVGKHVMCEKALATNSKDAEEMIAACKDARVKLMTAYRCHFEPNHLAVMEMVKSGELGKLNLIEAHHCQVQNNNEQWRHSLAKAGGGALWGIGIYCVNFARTIAREEPIEVCGKIWSPPNDARFQEVEATVSWWMRFPSGVLALMSASYDSFSSSSARLHFEKGIVELDPVFSYAGIKMKVKRLSSESPEYIVTEDHHVRPKNQFAQELDHMAECVLTNHPPRTTGEEGLNDLKVLEAIYQSAKVNNPIFM